MLSDRPPSASSDTSIAHQIFSALWALAFLGAAGAADSIGYTFSERLQGFLELNEGKLDHVIRLVQSACKLSPETREIFDDWCQNMAITLTKPDDIATWLSMYSCQLVPPTFDLSDGGLLTRVIGFGVECQTVNFIDAMVLGTTERRPTEPQAFRELVSAIGQVTQIADPGSSYGLSARQGYKMWRVARLGALLDPNGGATNEARDELRSAVRRLDTLFDSAK